MKPINIIGITIWTVLAAASGYGYSYWATSTGREVPISGLTLSISVVVVAVILISLALPIWKYKRNLKKIAETLKDNPTAKITKPLPVDPFFAVRVLTLAKAGAVTAGMLGGWHLGVLIKQYTAPVIVPGSIGTNIAAAVASLVLLITALIVERICRLPRDPGNPPAAKDSVVAA
jgi:hypothetical protein